MENEKKAQRIKRINFRRKKKEEIDNKDDDEEEEEEETKVDPDRDFRDLYKLDNKVKLIIDEVLTLIIIKEIKKH